MYKEWTKYTFFSQPFVPVYGSDKNLLWLFCTFVFKLMMEVTLVTKCDFYEDSWSKILPQLWQYTTENNLKALEDQGLTEEDLGNMDAGR